MQKIKVNYKGIMNSHEINVNLYRAKVPGSYENCESLGLMHKAGSLCFDFCRYRLGY